MNRVCIVFGILFLVCILFGVKRGLLRVIVSVAGLIVSMVVAVYVAPHVSGYLQEHTQLDEKIAGYITEELQFSHKDQEATRSIQVAVINELPLSESLKSTILDNNNSEMYNALGVSTVYDYITKSIAVVALNAVVFLLLIFICRIFFFFLGRSIGNFAKLPIVRSIDKIGGGLLGAMKWLILIWIFFLILSITNTFTWSQEIIKQINESAPLKLLYENNILLDIVGDLTKILFL